MYTKALVGVYYKKDFEAVDQFEASPSPIPRLFLKGEQTIV
jgi:hypothetical protein